MNTMNNIVNLPYIDIIHGELHLPSICWHITAHPYLQRLKNISQCSTLSLRYAHLDHTRWDHSLGTAHMAYTIMQRLQENTNKFTTREVLCVATAALLHDVGHGPYSNAWSKLKFVNHSHITMSLKIVRYLLLNDATCRETFANKDIELICNIIKGDINNVEYGQRFLVEIVNNSTGIDVKKVDCLLRDTHRIYGLQHMRAIKKELNFYKYCEIDECTRSLAFRYQSLGILQKLFYLRHHMYATIFECKANVDADNAFVDIVSSAHYAGYLINGQTLIKATSDIFLFIMLDNDILTDILNFLRDRAGSIDLIQLQYFNCAIQNCTLEGRRVFVQQRMTPIICTNNKEYHLAV